jgi:tRNA(fMet)-specific endonuclease VapC
MKGDSDVVAALKRIDQIGIATISIGELYSGFKGGRHEKKNRMELGIFLDPPRVTVFNIEVETADFYASILDNLKSNGTPIPTNDIWIAAVAFQNGCKLFSKDRHFCVVPGLIRFNNAC